MDEVRDAVAVCVLREGIKQQIGESGETGEFEGVRDAVAVGIGVAADDADETTGTGRTGELPFRRRVAAGREEEFGVDRRREGEEGVDLFLGLGRECQPGKVVIVVVRQPRALLEKENHLHVGLGIGPVEGLPEKGPIHHGGEIEGEENLHAFTAGGEGKEEAVVGKDIHDGIEGEEFRRRFAVAPPALGLFGRIEEFHLNGMTEPVDGRSDGSPGIEAIAEFKPIRIPRRRRPAEADRAVGVRFGRAGESADVRLRETGQDAGEILRSRSRR